MSESVYVVVHIVIQIPSVASGNRMRSVVTLSKRSELHYSIHVFHLRSNERGPWIDQKCYSNRTRVCGFHLS
jgi:hypothetical protein